MKFWNVLCLLSKGMLLRQCAYTCIYLFWIHSHRMHIALSSNSDESIILEVSRFHYHCHASTEFNSMYAFLTQYKLSITRTSLSSLTWNCFTITRFCKLCYCNDRFSWFMLFTFVSVLMIIHSWRSDTYSGYNSIVAMVGCLDFNLAT